MILTGVQHLLEECCFDFASRWLPSVLKDGGWDCAEALELDKWVATLRKNRWKLPDHAFQVGPGVSLLMIFPPIDKIEETAVHRLPTKATKVNEMIDHAARFAKVLRDPVREMRLEELHGRMEDMIRAMERQKDELESQNKAEMERIAEERVKLIKKESEALAKMVEEDDRNKHVLGSLIEDAFRSTILKNGTHELHNEEEDLELQQEGSPQSNDVDLSVEEEDPEEELEEESEPEAETGTPNEEPAYASEIPEQVEEAEPEPVTIIGEALTYGSEPPVEPPSDPECEPESMDEKPTLSLEADPEQPTEPDLFPEPEAEPITEGEAESTIEPASEPNEPSPDDKWSDKPEDELTDEPTEKPLKEEYPLIEDENGDLFPNPYGSAPTVKDPPLEEEQDWFATALPELPPQFEAIRSEDEWKFMPQKLMKRDRKKMKRRKTEPALPFIEEPIRPYGWSNIAKRDGYGGYGRVGDIKEDEETLSAPSPPPQSLPSPPESPEYLSSKFYASPRTVRIGPWNRWSGLTNDRVSSDEGKERWT
ncbi:MAG: hypothetical protein M1834_007812 [Cirrosporium novae-zelandiae]|nr:MAG: hypothetical protein M1834_007812 [Cirrosporium novae-zelandiae]